MFNAHHIHLDKDYAQTVDGYPGFLLHLYSYRSIHSHIIERLVHGPLTALMLLEAVSTRYPEEHIARFEYRARNPLLVGRTHTIYGVGSSPTSITLWCVDDVGVVGMTGKVDIEKP